MSLDKNNACIIRVWVPRDTDGTHVGSGTSTFVTTERIGHVSLETKNQYLSFWPNWDEGTAIKLRPETIKKLKEKMLPHKAGIIYSGTGQFLPCFDADFSAEGEVLPDYTIVLYSLDVTKIEAYIAKLKSDKNVNWGLTGRSLFRLYNSSCNNCAGVVYDTLKEGGLFKKLDVNRDVSRDYVVCNPNNVLKLVMIAKLDEIDRHQETAKFTYLNETPLSQFSQSKPDRKCSVM